MSFQSYPQPDACRALMPMPDPAPPGPPSTPMACHMPKGHEGMHSLDRRPGTLSRRWEGDARPPRPVTAAVPDPRFRDQLAEWLFDFTMRHKGSPWRWSSPDLTVSDLSDDLIRRTWRAEADRLIDDVLAAEVDARVQAAANQRAAEELHRAYIEDGTTVAKLSPVERLTCRIVKVEDLLPRIAALASPAPAPRTEEGQR